MAKLVLHGKEGLLREIPLDRQRVTIGRHGNNDVQLNDKATSSQHAAIIIIGQRCYLQDLKSTNGTLVNGTPIYKHTLKHGDVILIGRSHLSFVDEPEVKVAKTEPDSTPTKAEAAVTANGSPGPVAPTPEPPSAQPAAAKLEATVNEARDKDRKYEPWAERADENAPPRDMVDNMLNAIRSHREHERTQQVRRKEKVDQEWQKLIEAAQALKKRVGSHPRIKFFDISRDKADIMIRMERDGGKTGQHTILISRQHPHNPSPLVTIWLIESGQPDRHKDSCEEIMRDVMSTLAPLIA